MPNRILRPSILDSERVNLLGYPEEIFYRRLMSVVDDFGRFDARPSVLKAAIYPLRLEKVREADISRWTAACEKAGLIALYAVEGKPFLVLLRLGEPRARASKYPPPPSGVTEHALACASTCAHASADAPYSNAPSPSPSNTPLAPRKRGEVVLPSIPESLDTPEFAAAWAAWAKHRAERKPKLGPTAAGRQLAKLAGMGVERAIAAIEHSIAGSYQGIFEPGGSVGGGSTPTTAAERRRAEQLRAIEED